MDLKDIADKYAAGVDDFFGKFLDSILAMGEKFPSFGNFFQAIFDLFATVFSALGFSTL